MKRCCFMFFELVPGVRGLGVLFFLVNLILLYPIVDGWLQLLSPPQLAVLPPSAGPLLQLYRRHQRPLLALSAAAVGLGLLVNALLVFATAAPGHRPRRRRRLLLLPWLVWYAALFSAATAAVMTALVQWGRDRLALPAPAAVISVGLLPLYWYWFAAVVSLFRDFPTSPPPPPGSAREKWLVSAGVVPAGPAAELPSVAGPAGSAGAAAAATGNGATAGAETEEPAAEDSSLLQATLSRAVWYWAAINAAVLDEQERLRLQELLEQQEQEEQERPPRSLVSLDSVRSLWRRLTVGSEVADEPAEVRLGELTRPGGSGRRLLRRQRACVEEL